MWDNVILQYMLCGLYTMTGKIRYPIWKIEVWVPIKVTFICLQFFGGLVFWLIYCINQTVVYSVEDLLNAWLHGQANNAIKKHS